MIVEITSWAPTAAFSSPAIPAQTAPARVASDDREHDVQQPRHAGERRADPHGDVGADEVLALAADVEQPAAEGEGDREAGEDQRRGGDQRLLEVERRGRALVAEIHGKIQFSPVPLKIAL